MSSNFKTVVILRGAPGSGKSTFIQKNISDVIICSADDYHMKNGEYKFDVNNLRNAHRECMKKFKNALKQSAPLVVVDNTNTKCSEMKYYIRLAKKLNYDIRIIRMVMPTERLLGRNIHNVPDAIVEKFNNRIQDIPKEWNIVEIFVNGDQ
jgi:predicted kinase